MRWWRAKQPKPAPEPRAPAAEAVREGPPVAPEWSMAPVVQAYQAMRGASFLVAVTFAAELEPLS